MNERQQNAFLWSWNQRRKRGQGHSILFGAGIGAIGGLLFALLMLYAMTANGGGFRVDEEEAGPILGAIARLLGPTGFLFFLSIPAFAGLGALLSSRVWGMMEHRYHNLINAGFQLPTTPVKLTLKEQRGGLIVLGALVLLALFVLVMVIWEINRGAL